MNREAAAEFIVTMLNSRTSAHILHLKTRSYAEHRALEEFYEGVTPLTDRLAENLQGKYGILDYMDCPLETPSEGRALMQSLTTYVDSMRGYLEETSDVQNIVDEIVDLIARTNYKLNFLS